VKRPDLIAGGVMFLATLAVYFPYLGDAQVLFAYWDGPHYVYVAKTLYVTPADHPFKSYGLPASYFACHLPLYPLLIRVMTVPAGGDYFTAMLAATIITSVAASVLFYRLLVVFELSENPLWLAILFAFLPPRWLIYHSVGASEPLFLCLVFGAFLAFKAERPWMVMGCLLGASITRITGLMLLPLFMGFYAWRRDWRSTAIMPLAGIGLLLTFAWHAQVYGDFLAYFHYNVGQAGLVRATPFELFRTYASHPEFAVTEYHLGLYLVYGIGTLALWPRREFFAYCALFFAFNCFVFHVDSSRYFLPIAPFALLVGYGPILTRPACRWILPLVLYLGYFYAWKFLPFNICAPDTMRALAQALR